MKVLIVDNHELMREGLRAIMEQHGLEVVGSTGDAREAISQTRSLRPQVVIVDVELSGLNGAALTRRLMTEFPKTRIIGLASQTSDRSIADMISAGAVGYVLKKNASDELMRAVSEASPDTICLSPEVVGRVSPQGRARRNHSKADASKRLSVREREVLQLVADGKSSKEIAITLEIAVPTVETHRRQLMCKLALRTIAGLTKYALREGLTSIGC